MIAGGDIEHPKLNGLKTHLPVMFKDLRLLVKYDESPNVTIARKAERSRLTTEKLL